MAMPLDSPIARRIALAIAPGAHHAGDLSLHVDGAGAVLCEEIEPGTYERALIARTLDRWAELDASAVVAELAAHQAARGRTLHPSWGRFGPPKPVKVVDEFVTELMEIDDDCA